MKPGKPSLGRALLLGVLGLVAATCAGAGDTGQGAQAINTCAPLALDPPRLLRQISLDLRGAPPTYDELQAVVRAGEVTPDVIDGMLHDDRFLGTVERWHADLLWPNLNGFLVKAGPVKLTRGGTNPELVVDLLDTRTEESVCPGAGTGNLTSMACCTAANPNHPSCCLARNAAYNPADPACVAKSQALGAIYVITAVGDRPLRGGAANGCDDALEYPPLRVTAGDHRWLHDAANRPYYLSPRSGQVRYYYDQDDVPLPYDDWTHCPNYCRANVGSGPGGQVLPGDYVPKQRTVAGRVVTGDAAGAACPDGYTEVVNACDSALHNAPDDSLRTRREGYRLMQTYWSAGHWIKVCAYDAQERTNSVYTGQACNPSARLEPSCGCGPSGLYCTPSEGYLSTLATRTEARFRDALNEEPLQIVASVVGRDEDYYNAYTTRRSFITGPLSVMYHDQVARMSGLAITPPAAGDALPAVPYADAGWHEYVRDPQHAGVLTTPAWLGRFPTFRARINRFRTALLCQPFVPPPDGLPPPDDVCNREPNLAHRCGCQYCHTSIEPLGAYWGRWAERSATWLDPATFPVFDPNCATCAVTGQFCTPRCRTNYVTNNVADADGSRYAGTLAAYLYRSPEEQPRIEQGPAALVAASLSSGQMQACTVSTAWQRLLGRPMNDDETRNVLPTLLQHFEASHHNYRQLVRDVVLAPAYRRID